MGNLPHHAVSQRLASRSALCINLTALAVIGAFSLATPIEVHAQDIAVQIDIPPQSLDDSLVQLGKQTDLQLYYTPESVAGIQAPHVQGRMTPEQALQRLLQGSPVQYEREGKNATLSRPSSTNGGDAATLAPVTVTARSVVITEGSGSLTSGVVSLDKGDRALKDIPQSISVLTRTQLDEQNITDLREAANAVTGMVGAQGVGQGTVLSARGFQIDSWQYDGVAIPRNTYSLGNWGTEGMVFYDRLEVLRGASGLLQGTGSPGGAVNLVRKRGREDRTIAITAHAGSWNRYGLQLDAGGPLNKEGTLRGRVVLDESRSHSFVDYVNDRTRSFYAALDYDFSPDTTVGLGVSYMDSQGRPFVYGVPLHADGSDVGLPRSTFTGSWWNRAHVEQTTLYADLKHRFNPDWKLTVSALRMNERNTSTHQRMHGNVKADGSGVTYADWVTDFESTREGLDAYVNGDFQTFGLRNEITLGANYSKYTSDDMWARMFTTGGNIFDIDHNRPEPTVSSILAAGGKQTISTYDVRQKGVYASWRMRVTEPLTAIVGARVSWYDYLYHVPLTNYDSVISASSEVTPYAGLVYALTPEWSLYGSYTSVFEPQSARTVQGKAVDPIVGTNYEIGIKGELLDGRVNTSLALFRYDHKNRAIDDYSSGYACDGWYCSIASGKVRSQGVEAEISGEVFPNLQLMAGYTYNTTKYLRDPTNQGKVFSTWTPKHMLRVWGNYRLPGQWDRFSLGAGVVMQSHTLNTLDASRTFKIAGYSIWNLRVGYQARPDVSLALNINNLLDKRYVISGYTGYTGATYGEPRNVMLTLKYTPKW